MYKPQGKDSTTSGSGSGQKELLLLKNDKYKFPLKGDTKKRLKSQNSQPSPLSDQRKRAKMSGPKPATIIASSVTYRESAPLSSERSNFLGKLIEAQNNMIETHLNLALSKSNSIWWILLRRANLRICSCGG